MYTIKYNRTTFASAVFLILFYFSLCFITFSHATANEHIADNQSVIKKETLVSKELTLRTVSVEQLSRALDLFTRGSIDKLVFYVNFAFDKAQFTELYQQYLKEIGVYVSRLNKNGVTFAIEGHTDGIGTDVYNMDLSMRRAYAVRQYFKVHFKLSLPIHIQHWGKRRPRQSNASSSGRRENRRVELILQRNAMPRPPWPVSSKIPVTFSADGRYIVSVNKRGDGLKQWNFRYSCRQTNLNGLSARPYSIVYAPNGRLLSSAGADKRITLWDAETGVAINNLSGHQDIVTETAFASDSQWLLSGSFDKTVKYWDLSSAFPIHTFSGHKDKVLSVALSPDGNLGASASTDGEIILWDINRKKRLKKIAAHKKAVTSIRFDPSGSQLYSASLDGTIKQWNIEDGSIIKRYSFGNKQILSIRLNKNGRNLLAVTQKKGLIMLDVLSGSIIKSFSNENVELTAMDFSSDGKHIAVTDINNRIHIWRTDTAKKVNILSELRDEKFQETADSGSNAQSLPPMPELSAGQQWIEPNTGMTFVWVPGGCFQMGCGFWTDSCSENEKPVHESCLDGFWIGQYEITQGQWIKIMGENPSRAKKGDLYPVDQISWHQTQDFICRMNTLTGKSFRLPSEAEWEYACRGAGKQAKYGYLITNKDKEEEKDSEQEQVNNNITGPNTLGLYNMSGGVWEWNLDLYADTAYVHHEQLNPVFKGENDYHFTNEKFDRVERGGVWDIGSTPVRCSHREYDEPAIRSFYLGARLLLIPD